MANINFTPLQTPTGTPTAPVSAPGGIHFTPLNASPATHPAGFMQQSNQAATTPPAQGGFFSGAEALNNNVNQFLSTPAYDMGQNTSGIGGTLGKETANIAKSGLKFGKGVVDFLNPFNTANTLKQIPSAVGGFLHDITAAGTSIAQGDQLAAKAQALPARPGHAFAGPNAQQIQTPSPASLLPDYTAATEKVTVPEAGQLALKGQFTKSLQSLANDPFQLAPALLAVKGVLETPTGGTTIDEASGAPKPATVADTAVGGAVDKTLSTIAKPGVKAIDLTGKAVSGVKTIADTLAKYGTAQATGLNPKTISTILENPEKFLGKNYQSDFTREGLGQKVSTAIDQRLEDLSATGKEYQTIRKSGGTVQIPPGTLQNVLDNFNVKLDGKGNIKTTSETLPMSSGDKAALQNFIDTYGKKSELTNNGFLNARKTLSNMAKYDTTKTDASTAMSRALRAAYDAVGKDQVPGLKELDAQYAPETKLLQQIKKDYLQKDGTFKDNALSKLANLTNAGRESVLARLEQIIPGITKEITVLKAVEDITNASGHKVGTYTRAATTLGTYAAAGLPGAIVEGILTNPKIATQILAGYGKLLGVDVGGVFDKVLNSPIKTPNVGLTTEAVGGLPGEAPPKGQGEIPSTTPKALDENYQVGLSNVAGKGYEEGNPQNQSDVIMEQAKSLSAEGKTQEAQAKYEEAVNFGIRKVQDSFKGSGIKLTTLKPTYGVFESGIEPSLDITATVPKGKEGVFYQKLSTLADENFNQKSFITYKAASENAPYGWIDQTQGTSNEPMMRITFKTPLKLDQVDQVYQLMKDNGLPGGTFKNGNSSLDILNLSHYNNEYGQFSDNLAKLQESLDKQGILGDAQQQVAEVRHIGSETNAPATYKSVQRAFYGENPGLKPRGTKALQSSTSKVLDRLPLKETVGKQEIQQILNSPDITAAEKKITQDVLAQQGDKISTSDFAYKLRQHFLSTSPEAANSYADYGLENLGTRYENAQTTLLRTGVDTGVSGHFNVGDELGHIRTFEKEQYNSRLSKHVNKDKSVFVSEIQSDPFQRGLNIQSLDQLIKESEVKKTDILNSIAELKADNAKNLEQIKSLPDSILKQSIEADIERNNARIASRQQTLTDDTPKLENLKAQQASGKKFLSSADQEVLKLQNELTREQAGLEHKLARNSAEVNTSDIPYSAENIDRHKEYIAQVEKNLAEAQKEATKANPQLTAKTEQMMNLAKDNKYRKNLLNDTLVTLRDKGYKEINLPTPSTVAKIEWGKGADNEDTMPYEVLQANDHQNLTHGDTIDYGGEKYTVVDTSNGLTVAPSYKVNTFKFSDFQTDEANNALDNASSEIKDLTKKYGNLNTPKVAQKVLDKEGSFDSWELENALKKVADGQTTDLEQQIQETGAEHADIQTLRDMYGQDNVFAHDIGYGHDSQVYTVKDGSHTETFAQPGDYTTPFDYSPSEIDNNKAEASKIFSQTEMGVLDNYYELQKNLKSIQKETDITATPFEDDSGNTWIKVKPNKNLKKTPF